MSRERAHREGSGRPAEEAELIRRCRAGERHAQAAFYRRYRYFVAANLYRVLRDRGDLDDLVQEVFVIAFRGLGRFRGEARLSTWLYRICVNVALGRIRSRRRRPPPVLVAEPDPLEDPTSVRPETPERLLQRKQEHQRLMRLVERLPLKKQIVFRLHELEGLDLRQIASLVDANPITVRTRLFYARKELHERVVERGE